MTKEELSQAQRLYSICHDALDVSEERDPKREREDSISRTCDAISSQAGAAFRELTGRPIYKVSFTELSTIDPASWTKLPKEERS